MKFAESNEKIITIKDCFNGSETISFDEYGRVMEYIKGENNNV